MDTKKILTAIILVILAGLLSAQLEEIGNAKTEALDNPQSVTIKGEILSDNFVLNPADLNGNGIPDSLENFINNTQLSGSSRYLPAPNVLTNSGNSPSGGSRIPGGNASQIVIHNPPPPPEEDEPKLVPSLNQILDASWTEEYHDTYDPSSPYISERSGYLGASVYEDRALYYEPEDYMKCVIKDLDIALQEDHGLSLSEWPVKLFTFGCKTEDDGMWYSVAACDSGRPEKISEIKTFDILEEDSIELSTYQISLFSVSNGEYAAESLLLGGQFSLIYEHEFEDKLINIPYAKDEPSDADDEVWDEGKQFSAGYYKLPFDRSKMEFNSALLNDYHVRVKPSSSSDWEMVTSSFKVKNSSHFDITLLAKRTANIDAKTDLEVTTSYHDADRNWKELESFSIQLTPYRKGLLLGLNINTDETSGSKYRKIGLNGRSMSDTKPQGDAENDIEKEETYVDALTLDLFHSVTDIYVPVPASDLVLSVRRNARSTTWGKYSGLRPSEKTDAPFGAGWTSNLVSYVVLNEQTNIDGELVALMSEKDRKENGLSQTTPNTATVIDENGSSYNFIINYSGSSNVTRSFTPTPSDKTQLSSYLVELSDLVTSSSGSSSIGDPMVFTKKQGTKLTFENGIDLLLANNRDEGSKQYTKKAYYRLESVSDKAENTLKYAYPDVKALIPEMISVEGRDELVISIEQSRGRVSSVQDPNGNVYSYSYKTATMQDARRNELGESQVTVLDNVNKGAGVVTTYEYDLAVEDDHRHPSETSTGDDLRSYNKDNVTYDEYTAHLNLKSIDGPYNDDTCKFEYEFDLSRKPYTVKQERDLNGKLTGKLLEGAYFMSGMPRNVRDIELPGGRSTKIESNHLIESVPEDPNNNVEAELKVAGRNTTVTDVEGHKKFYSWDENKSNSMEIPKARFDYLDKEENNVSRQILIGMTEMKLSYYEGSANLLGTETFTYDPEAGYAPSHILDYSGNETNFTYNDVVASHPFNGNGLSIKYADPNIQTNALNDDKVYTYDNQFRVMKSIRDENGNTTSYELNSLGLRTKETIKDSGGRILSITEFNYSNSSFPKFMTSRVRRASGTSLSAQDPSWVGDLTTIFEPDANGRVVKEIIDLDGSGSESPDDLVTTHEYDPNGNKLNTTDPRGFQTGYHYDSLNRVVKIVHQDGTSNNITYDKRSNKVLEEDENGVKTGYFYDNTNRLRNIIRDMNGNLSFNNVDVSQGSTLHDIFSGVEEYDESSLSSYLSGENSYDLITGFSYNKADSRETATDSRGFITKTVYDGMQRPIQIITPKENSSPGVVPQSSANGYVTTYEYDPAQNTGGSIFNVSGFQSTKSIDPRGYETIQHYDALYRPTTTLKEYDLDSSFYAKTLNEFDALGNTIRVTKYRNPYGSNNSPRAANNSLTTQTDYDGLNRTTVVTKAFGSSLSSTVTTSYTSTGFTYRVTDQVTASETRVTDNEYDRAGRLIISDGPPVYNALTATSGERPRSQNEYDKNGNIIKKVNPLGEIWEYRFDARNRRVHEIQPEVTDAMTSSNLGESSESLSLVKPVITTEYDNAGNVIKVINTRQFTTETLYDDAYRVLKVTTPEVYLHGQTSPQALTSQNSYDANGNVLQAKDQNGNLTINSYDSLNRLVSTKSNSAVQASSSSHSDDIVVTNTYDSAGNLIMVKDGENHITSFEYDGLDRKIRTIWDSDSSSRKKVKETEYDALREVTVRNPNEGGSVSYTSLYDERLRLIEIVFASGYSNDDQKYTYDLADRKTSVSHPNDPGIRDTAYVYDHLDRTISETSGGITHQYEYDLVGNTIKTTYGGGGKTLICSYDALNRLESMTESGTRVTKYYYDLGGNTLEKHLPNGLKTTSGFDPLGRKTQIFNGTAECPISSYHYEYDANANVLSVEERQLAGGVPSRSIRNFYDRVNRLTEETITDAFSTETTAYGYDKTNNRTSRVKSADGSNTTTTYIYGNTGNGYNSNQLVSYVTGTDDEVTYTYDDNGNRISKSQDGNLLQQYTYDLRNRLLNVIDSDLGDFTYAYDARTRRVNRDESVSSVPDASQTTLSFSNGLSALEYDDGATSPEVEYIRGSDYGGGIGGVLYTFRDGAPTFNSYNSRGDVICKTSEVGGVNWQASYEAFGTRTIELGENKDRQKANTKDEDPWGALNEGFRYRDLETGVFLTRDPLGFVDGPNEYTYVRQNPWSAYDPDGLLLGFVADAGFAIFDTVQYARGKIDTAEYGKRMALTGASVIANAASGGTAGLAVRGASMAARAGSATVKVAKAVDKANTTYETASSVAANGEAFIEAAKEGDIGGMAEAGAGLAMDLSGGGKKDADNISVNNNSNVTSSVSGSSSSQKLTSGDQQMELDLNDSRMYASTSDGKWHPGQKEQMEELGVTPLDGDRMKGDRHAEQHLNREVELDGAMGTSQTRCVEGQYEGFNCEKEFSHVPKSSELDDMATQIRDSASGPRRQHTVAVGSGTLKQQDLDMDQVNQ